MSNFPPSKPNQTGVRRGDLDIDDDSDSSLRHTGEQPAHRPPEDEPERVGEGELDIGPPAIHRSTSDRAWEGEEDGDGISADAEND